MAGEVHELSEVLVRRVFLNSKAWHEYISDTNGKTVLPPESVIAELAEAIKTYTDTHSKEAVRQIVRMTFDLEGYKEYGLEMWKLLYKINNIRVQMLAINPKDKQKHWEDIVPWLFAAIDRRQHEAQQPRNQQQIEREADATGKRCGEPHAHSSEQPKQPEKRERCTRYRI